MLTVIEALLDPDTVAQIRARLAGAGWIDGNATSGVQSALAKRNLQLPEDSAEARELGEIVLQRLGADPSFNAAALPRKVFPPLFNRYDAGMGFGSHVDNALRYHAPTRQRFRTDLSATLFLSDPADYDGGELVIEDDYGSQSVKLPAGAMVLYPSGSLHHVTPVTRGSRWASFFWVQSMVRDDGDRALLYRFDRAITLARAEMGDAHPAVLALTATFHNLLRKWSET